MDLHNFGPKKIPERWYTFPCFRRRLFSRIFAFTIFSLDRPSLHGADALELGLGPLGVGHIPQVDGRKVENNPRMKAMFRLAPLSLSDDDKGPVMVFLILIN